jgi:protein-disulfide isomerase
MTKEIRQLGLIGLVIVLVVAVIGGVAWYKQSTAPTSSEAQVRSDSHITGVADAKVTLVEFGDYQCPACGQAEPIVEQIREAYKDQSFRFVFRNYPLSIHPNAPAAAEAAEAAGAQGKFWEMHDLLYENQTSWADSADPKGQFSQYAKQIGIADLNKFDQQVKSTYYAARIRADQKDGDSLGVQVTPTFFLNGQKIEGVQTFDAMKQKIDALLAETTTSQASSSSQASDSATQE